MLRNRQLTGGLIMFFFQYLVQAGFFFVVPLYLSVCLGLSALATAPACCRCRSLCSPPRSGSRSSGRTCRRGSSCAVACSRCSQGRSSCSAGSTTTRERRSSFVPLLLIGLGIGALASQLGSVTVSAVPDDESPEVGGVQNTMTNLGASLGTALAGSLLIAARSAAS